MLCEICGIEEGRIKFTKVINGEKIEFYICEDCAKKKGFLSVITQSEEDKEKGEKDKIAYDTECSICGCRLIEVENKGKFGCPHCYITFRSYINTIIGELHGGERHKGKTPILDRRKLVLKKKIREVKKELDNAIKKERYEIAAELRDKIKILSLKMGENE